MSDNNNILNNIDRTQTWVDVETVAKLKGITKRGVRLSLNQNKYEYRVENVRGGKTYKIKLSTLEEEYQIKYIQVAYLLADEKVIEREFGAFDAINDNYPKYVITLDKMDFSRNGIIHKNIIDFLLCNDF